MKKAARCIVTCESGKSGMRRILVSPFPDDPLPTIRMHALAGNGKKPQRNVRPIAARLPGDRAKNVRIQANERNTAA